MNEQEARDRSGDEPATPEQESYLDTLNHELGDDRPKGMTKEGAEEKIAELRGKVEDLEGDAPTADSPAAVTPITPNGNR